ncbi:MAG: carboxypeptidase-like regulatory domain-containing protein, partial [Prolixibacteraceae bacterium]|nr:carboxypeptidase-like regulatory domain-containing protein [Prolixibacteraceae bacterium]
MNIKSLLILITSFLFSCNLCVHADTINSQNIRVTLNKSNEKLENILNEIENQTELLFIYNKNINVNKKVSVNVKEQPLPQVLKSLLGESVTYKLEGSYILLSENDGQPATQGVQQNKSINGKVQDPNGESIIGANVVEKGTSNGTITDIDGNFTLSLQKPNAVLQISYIGYTTQEVRIGSASSLTIKLVEDSETLDEVVVVGYGVQKRASVTGSVASLQSKEITTVKTPNVSNALAGKLPGLRAVQRSGAPGDDASSIDIRGFGNALVIVDGVERDFRQI